MRNKFLYESDKIQRETICYLNNNQRNKDLICM